jgi:hypothetical protein
MRNLVTLAGIIAIMTSPVSFAEVSDAEIQALREQIRLLTERLDELEKANQQSAAAAPQSGAAVSDEELASIEEKVDEKIETAVSEQVDEKMAAVSWAERMRWKGDFRYRYETIKVEDLDKRSRNRIRARAHLEADITDTLQVGIGLATGGDDPVSTNQTLGGGGSTKDIRLDLAYFDWSGLSNTHILGGKVKNFLVRAGGNGMMWDGDWRPEGFGANWDNGTFFAHGIGTWIESDSKEGDEFSWIAQAGMKFKLGDSAKLKLGAGYARFDTAGAGSFYGDTDDFFGNSYDPVTKTYLYDYHEIEAFAELGFDLGGRPTMLFANYVTNTDADENDTGYALGFKYGKASAKGNWELGYVYQRLEADSVLGLLTDSDFGGGGTDAKGSIFKGKYAFHENWNAAVTYFLNDINIASDNPQDFDRLQLDLNFKYK